MINLKAQKSLGQNFLVDPKAHEKIVAAVNPGADDVIVEVGPGTGLLTRQLLASPLQKLVAFELDRRAVPELEREFASEGERFRVVEQDFLQVDLGALRREEFGAPSTEESGAEAEKKLRVVGNIPYYITSPILFKLLDDRAHVSNATLLVQLEVAERLTAEPSTKEYGIPTVLANFFGEVTYRFKVPAGAFRPVPKVDSAVIQVNLENGYFTRTGASIPDGFDVELFRKVVRTLFGMRRKTVRNNLKALVSPEKLVTLERGSAARFFGLRAEAMSIADFIELTEAVRTA